MTLCRGVLLDEPHTKQIDGKLRELRDGLNGDQFRFTYWIAPGRRIILLTRDRRMAEPGARDGYEAEKRAYMLGQAVKQRRTALGMTQRELGRRARLTQSAVARLEAGDGVPTLRVLERIAHALGAELDVTLRDTQGPAEGDRSARSGKAAKPAKPVHC